VRVVRVGFVPAVVVVELLPVDVDEPEKVDELEDVLVVPPFRNS
jgi:hypothetical protein